MLRLAQFALRKVHARQIAPIVRQRYQGVLVADVPQVHAEVRFTAQQFSQLRNREPVTGVHADNRGAVREKLVDLGFKLLREVLELRSKARLKPLPCPHQLAAERGQAGSPPLLPLHQRRSEEGGPLLDQVPRVPVRYACLLGGPADLSRHADFVQEIQHHQDGLGIVPLETPYRFDFDVDHIAGK